MSSGNAGKKKISRIRGIVILVVFLSIVAGLIIGDGWGTLSSMGVGAVAYICPVGGLETLVAGRSPVLRTILQIVVVLLVVALVGRAFCAWVCPVPPLRHFFHPKKKAEKAAEAEKAEQQAETGEAVVEAAGAAGHSCHACGGCHALPPVGGKRDGLRIDSRHGVLLGAIASSAVFGFPVFCLICPIGLSIAVVIGVYRALFEQDPTWSLLVFIAILLVELVFFRKWCRRICPVGALMSLVGAKAPLFKPRVSAKKCLREQGVDCRVCVSVCPEQLDPHCKSIPECTRCGECADACPVGAISLLARKPGEGDAPAGLAAGGAGSIPVAGAEAEPAQAPVGAAVSAEAPAGTSS